MDRGQSRYAALGIVVLLTVAGCRQSRIVDLETLDVCELVSPAETDRILGSAIAASTGPEGGFAGSCTWSFQAGGAAARLSAHVMTQASASNLLTTPKAWFENPVRLGDLKVNQGDPREIKGLGYVAWLYGTTLHVRKGEVVILLHTDHGDVEQMEQVAQTLLSPKKG